MRSTCREGFASAYQGLDAQNSKKNVEIRDKDDQKRADLDCAT
jgi:hypothetical protein